jgi:hypothetical protein
MKFLSPKTEALTEEALASRFGFFFFQLSTDTSGRAQPYKTCPIMCSFPIQAARAEATSYYNVFYGVPYKLASVGVIADIYYLSNASGIKCRRFP